MLLHDPHMAFFFPDSWQEYLYHSFHNCFLLLNKNLWETDHGGMVTLLNCISLCIACCVLCLTHETEMSLANLKWEQRTEQCSSSQEPECLFITSCFCLFVCLFFVFLFFRDRLSLYSPACPGTHFVDQAGLELRNPPAPASWVLGLKMCATTPSFCFKILFIYFFHRWSVWMPRSEDKLKESILLHWSWVLASGYQAPLPT